MKNQKLINKFSLKPLKPEYFVGRSNQVLKILNLGLENENLGLINLQGPQKIGRTSFLHYLTYLAENEGGETSYAFPFNATDDELNCLYLDMRFLAGLSEIDSHQAFLQAISQLITKKDYLETDQLYTANLLIDEMINRTDQRYFLFLDRAEELLNPQIQEIVSTVLGVLNDGLPKLGILLSFGTSGDLSHRDVVQRAQQTDECIASISTLMGLFRNDINLGLLDPNDAQDYLMRRWKTEESKSSLNNNGPFSQTETSWLLNLSGEHPYILNLVGQLAFEAKSSNKSLDNSSQIEIENAASTQLRPLIIASLKRLSPITTKTILEVAQSHNTGIKVNEIDERVIIDLQGEGLISMNDNRVIVPSQMVRNILIESAIEQRSNGKPSIDPTKYYPEILMFRKNENNSRSVIEISLTSTKSFVPTEEIYRAIWATTSISQDAKLKQRLIQRIKILREKLQQKTGEKEIENVYGSGYRMIRPERFSIKSTN
jgi:hypothetical protein